MKIAFYDIKPFEKIYFEENLNSTFEKYYFPHSLNCRTEIDEKTKEAEILSVFIDSDLSKKVLEKFPNLKFIILRSVGYSHVDLCYAKERGIVVFNAPHYGDSSIAEYVFALLLSVSRNIVEAAYDVKNQKIDDGKYEGVELKNKTIGIVGLGAIGKKVAEIAAAFSMNVIYNDVFKNENFEYASIEELCQKSDIISINCPLNDKTLYMFDHNKFELMKKGVIIINTARGEIIKTCDLYKALISGKIKFFAADVVECESVIYEDTENPVDIFSVKDNCLKNFYVTKKLTNMKNVVITPHIAYNTKEARQKILEITIENIIASTKFTTGAKNLVLI